MPKFDLSSNERRPSQDERGDRSLEKHIWQTTVFEEIDLNDPKHFYHKDMLRGLIYQKDPDQSSLIRQIFSRPDIVGKDIKRITAKSIVARDISHDLGTKRNVDRFSFQFSDGTEFHMTVSLDREPNWKATDSPSLCEAAALTSAKRPVPGFQTYLGSLQLPTADGRKGLICKEFLPGFMLAKVTKDIEGFVAEHGQEKLKKVMNAVAFMMKETLETAGGLPVDSHAMNIILLEDKYGNISARYCDVEYIRGDASGIMNEVVENAKLFPGFEQEFYNKVYSLK